MVRHSVIPFFLASIILLIHATPLKPSTRLGDAPTQFAGTVYDFFFDETKALDDVSSDYDLFTQLFAFAGDEELLKSAGRDRKGFTLFAPTDEALTQTAKDVRQIFQLNDTQPPSTEEAAWEVYQAWLDTLDNPEATLSRILRYHIVIDGEISRANLQELVHPILNTSINQVILLSGITLVHADERFSDPQLIMMGCHFSMNNGVVHPIDRMLFPGPNGLKEEPEHVPPTNEMTPSATPPKPTEQSTGNPGSGSVQGAPSTASGAGSAEEPSDGATQEAACFPASSSVHLSDGSTIPISQLSAGHVVMSSTRERKSSPVYLFSHRQHEVMHDFVRITSLHGHEITLTPGHYLYANDRKTVASRVKLGDFLQTVDGESFVTSITKVREKGLFAPHTLHGDLVVNGILASSYTIAVSPRIAHILLWPLRVLVRAGVAVEPLGGLLYNGSPRLAAIIPGGSDLY